MGIKDWFKPRSTTATPDSGVVGSKRTGPSPNLGLGRLGEGQYQVAGTTTTSKAEALALAERHGVTDHGVLEAQALLAREPENPVDPDAVAVNVEGSRIGYAPGYVAKELDLAIGVGFQVPVQVWAAETKRGPRVEAWIWLGSTTPSWEHSSDNPPPLTADEKKQAQHNQRSSIVRDGLAEGGTRAAHFKSGMVDGVHYLELVEPIKELKRQGRNEEALVLCYEAIEGAENDNEFDSPAPWYTIQAAIVHRKLGQRDEEIAVLERWMAAASPSTRKGSEAADRLAKLLG